MARNSSIASAVETGTPRSRVHRDQAVHTDDLTRIAGIGPRIAGLLAGAGIRCFADLARAHPAWLRNVLDEAGPSFRTHDSSTWGRQADLAAAGDWQGLRCLQNGLFRGRSF